MNLNNEGRVELLHGFTGVWRFTAPRNTFCAAMAGAGLAIEIHLVGKSSMSSGSDCTLPLNSRELGFLSSRVVAWLRTTDAQTTLERFRSDLGFAYELVEQLLLATSVTANSRSQSKLATFCLDGNDDREERVTMDAYEAWEEEHYDDWLTAGA